MFSNCGMKQSESCYYDIQFQFAFLVNFLLFVGSTATSNVLRTFYILRNLDLIFIFFLLLFTLLWEVLMRNFCQLCDALQCQCNLFFGSVQIRCQTANMGCVEFCHLSYHTCHSYQVQLLVINDFFQWECRGNFF